ncbi:MAG: FAD-dependent oxidoreductase [Chloroflexi bacterium]|nr:FAD-dependent oxidoreductase [Chloroflexota bacterium]
MVAPCQNTCPLGTPVPQYVGLIAKGAFQEALDLVREDNPFPGVCGRVCPRPCESACRRGTVDEPVAICDLKRFIADEVSLPEGSAPVVVAAEDLGKVAVIGSGPAGLTAAYHLAKQGCRVTVFEALPVVGGMMAVGIPEYRLPREVLNSEIRAIEELAVQIHTGMRIGKDIDLDELLARGFRAVFVAVGAHQSNKLGIPGEERQGVLHGTNFLRDVNLNGQLSMAGRSVAVVGGGDVAIDAARSALRLAAREVHVVYRRSSEEMPAQQAEIRAAAEEGVKFHYLAAPKQVLGGNGAVEGLECIRMQLGGWDSSGRRRPEPVAGSEFHLDVDVLIPAIGQSPDLGLFNGNGHGDLVNRGLIMADRRTMATQRPGVFAGGDAVTGPATVIQAIAAGAKAAKSMVRYLKGEELFISPGLPDKTRPPEADSWSPAEGGTARSRMPELDPERRKRDFREVETGLTRQSAVREAGRCLRCDWEE